MESEEEHEGAEEADLVMDPKLEPESPSKQRPLSRLQRLHSLQQKRC